MALSQAALAKEVLAEIPDQFLSYMKKHNIKPKLSATAPPWVFCFILKCSNILLKLILELFTCFFFFIYSVHVKTWQFTCILAYWIESNFNYILTNLWVLHCTNTQLYRTVTCITTEILFPVHFQHCSSYVNFACC